MSYYYYYYLFYVSSLRNSIIVAHVQNHTYILYIFIIYNYLR